jgi:hypothetical protein
MMCEMHQSRFERIVRGLIEDMHAETEHLNAIEKIRTARASLADPAKVA